MSAKLTIPVVSGVVERQRLYALLAPRPGAPITWLSGCAGSGKSTLVASYLAACRTGVVWYSCDEGDADLATFFYYMGRAVKKAAPRFRQALPLLTPEYHAGVPAFTRHYFELLYRRVTTIVLDNYQTVPADSPLHTMLAIAFDQIPEGVQLLVVSRDEPPPAFARLLANGRVCRLQDRDLRFTLAETSEIVRTRLPAKHETCVDTLYEKTDGWIAGIILLLEQCVLDGIAADQPAHGASVARIFDYFAGEMLARVDGATRDFLLKTAVLPACSVISAEKLTGNSRAGQILATLQHRHFFTERLAGSSDEYQYHPLFREFLVTRAKSELSPRTLLTVQQTAAGLLEQDGQLEAAAQLYGEISDHTGLIRMIREHGRQLLQQGRNKLLHTWLDYMPKQKVAREPWLLYWQGRSCFPIEMERSYTCLQQAFAGFIALNNSVGCYLAWAGMVDCRAFGMDDWQGLEETLLQLEELRRCHPAVDSQELELVVVSHHLMALILCRADQPQQIQQCLDRLNTLLQDTPSPDIRMDSLFGMSLYYLWLGDYAKHALVLEQAETTLKHCRQAPFKTVRLKLMRGIHQWVTAAYEDAVQTLSEGLELAADSGIHAFDSLLWGFRSAAAMASGNLPQAVVALGQQQRSLQGRGSTLDTYFQHINTAWLALLNNDPRHADEHLQAASLRAQKLGAPYYRALCAIGEAQAAWLQGQPELAVRLLQQASRLGRSIKSHILECQVLLNSAWVQLQQQNSAEGLLALHRALSLGRQYGYVHLEFYQPGMMRLLCAKALEEQIEPDYVVWLVSRLRLTPPQMPKEHTSQGFEAGFLDSSVVCLATWPFPVRIHTLGRFEILRHGESLACAGKEQKKPLELLKVLIAAGGRQVSEEYLTDLLWPDAEGDQAHKAFETTLSRLRKLLGGDHLLKYQSRQLSLDTQYCWVDSLALQRIADTLKTCSIATVPQLLMKAVELYQGGFLPADAGLTWAAACRETLKNKLLRILLEAGRIHEQNAEWEQAAELYEKGIEADRLAEEFYRRLMICQCHFGNHAAAARTYQHCRYLLQSELGIAPSPQTTAVFTSLTSHA
ncbi:AAA family ATPase [Trichlorobacter lovleyi]|uniref:BTAD domain-containing putative transcriptional regulator n=1 Tax=Trichlorobacter lovleyi TaxID=313985 RepID=UPI00223F8E54|nr:BTAD domain-containing putative transcriptional regulator [Trichlorobacter lovleyi]QOX77970.1 AAA family ATPase [Trichlorobacter lovleyi]